MDTQVSRAQNNSKILAFHESEKFLRQISRVQIRQKFSTGTKGFQVAEANDQPGEAIRHTTKRESRQLLDFRVTKVLVALDFYLDVDIEEHNTLRLLRAARVSASWSRTLDTQLNIQTSQWRRRGLRRLQVR